MKQEDVSSNAKTILLVGVVGLCPGGTACS
jgi:hypothetical protein